MVDGEVVTFSQVRELVGAREKSLRDTYKGEELVAKVKEVRIAKQYGLGYLQMMVMEDQQMVEKQARAQGLGDVKVLRRRNLDPT